MEMVIKLPVPKKEVRMQNEYAVVPARKEVVQFDTSILAGTLAPSSYKKYQRDIEAYMRFAGSHERIIDPATLSEWRTVLVLGTKYSPNTINRMMAAVKRLMDEAAEKHYIPRSVSDEFKSVRGVTAKALRTRLKQNSRTMITPDQMRDMVDKPYTKSAIGKRDRAILYTLASSGARIGELASLTKEQILFNGTHYFLSIMGKAETDEPRLAPLRPEAKVAIDEWLAVRPVESKHIFISFAGKGREITGKPLSEVSLWRIVRKYAILCGMDHVKPYDFRRFVGTQLAKEDIRKAQLALGHKRIDTTARHYDLNTLPGGLTDHLF
jgi:integrase/recombinase XerD